MLYMRPTRSWLTPRGCLNERPLGSLETAAKLRISPQRLRPRQLIIRLIKVTHAEQFDKLLRIDELMHITHIQ